ncbi:MAG: phosphoglycerate dehydrogenase [Clostridiales Family XIII bacterium]|jgi:D-3-phosphoglycerate dehydrogenase|nr:phosphoglycerate dehydrogenase [Clostridiales Family XIII bacterium]
MKVLITPRSYGKHSDIPFTMLDEKGVRFSVNDTGDIMSEAALREAIADVDGVIIGVEPLTADILSAAPGVRAISKYGVGTDNIDLAYCERAGIKVSKATGANSEAVADYTFTLMLTLARKVLVIDRECRRRNWKKITTTDVANKTLGLIGLGAIGRNVVQRAKGFNMEVLAYDVYWDEPYAQDAGVTYAEVDEICQKADFISLHVPLLDETRHIIDAHRIAQMKPDAYIVNTARGGLIDEDALLTALIEERIGGAGLDVFAQEPPADERWYDLDNVILGSHCAASTIGASDNMGVIATRNLIKDLGL